LQDSASPKPQRLENPKIYLQDRRAACFAQLKSRVGLTLAKASTLRIMLNIDGASITSKSHTHPSHSQTCRL
jgi:hypothetical protein